MPPTMSSSRAGPPLRGVWQVAGVLLAALPAAQPPCNKAGLGSPPGEEFPVGCHSETRVPSACQAMWREAQPGENHVKGGVRLGACS